MKKISCFGKIALVAIILSLSSCIGSFNLTNSLYRWNNNIGSKPANEGVFLAFVILPVYSITLAADALVLNSIEFWQGTSMASTDQKSFELNGKEYRLTGKQKEITSAERENLQNEGKLVFNENDNSWYLKRGKKLQKLVEINSENGEITSYNVTLPDGSEKTIAADFDPITVKNQIMQNYN